MNSDAVGQFHPGQVFKPTYLCDPQWIYNILNAVKGKVQLSRMFIKLFRFQDIVHQKPNPWKLNSFSQKLLEETMRNCCF